MCKFGARAVELAAQGHVFNVYHDIPDSCQIKILNPEVSLIQSTAVWHVFSFISESRLGEQPLQGSEDVLVCALRGSCVLRTALQMVAVGIDRKAFQTRRHSCVRDDATHSSARYPVPVTGTDS